MGIQEVACAEHFRPGGNIVGDHALTRTSQGLSDPRRPRETVQNRFGICSSDELKNVRQQFELRARVFDTLRFRGIDDEVVK